MLFVVLWLNVWLAGIQKQYSSDMPAHRDVHAWLYQQKQYRVGVDDVLSISVSHDDLKIVAPVASDGPISFPYIGRVGVKGMNLPDIEREISQKLAMVI